MLNQYNKHVTVSDSHVNGIETHIQGSQLVDDASEKVTEIKASAQKEVEQTTEADTQLVDSASKKTDEMKDSTANTILGTAIHAKDVTVEKVQELGHSVVETVQRVPEVAVSAASLVGEKLTVAGHWAAGKATEVRSATYHSAQEAIHNLTGLAGQVTAKAEEAVDQVIEKGRRKSAEWKQQLLDKVDEAKDKANVLASDVKNNEHEVKQASQHEADEVKPKGEVYTSASHDFYAPH
ncbi:unnamed protein product [Rotaria magnacalcarata]|uniref:Uncharacterized protein n=1 Tax=Rotaria magnacalcarata TaxID=392030 RepID=A0A816ZIB8_9BILA|nr:unnamed protein product [Rotaria magnacalcarata]CAF2092036.1 unnamed protein product [Rotaria magnacalcarata]CAF2207442.1 unnamed protein product [Rotaria magnacalcarata]